MKLINKNMHTVTMKYPASWHGTLEREGLVSGNGHIGANVYGGVQRESVIITHSALWSGKECKELPNVSDSLKKTRQEMDNGEFHKAQRVLADELLNRGYDNERDFPLPLAELNIKYSDLTGFSNYLRAINMETGEVSSQFKENGSWIKKDLFVSRADGMIIFKISSERPLLNAEFSVDMISDKGNICFESENVKKYRKISVSGNVLKYTSVNTDGLTYGAAVKIESTDGKISSLDQSVKVNSASEILVKIKVFINSETDINYLENELNRENENYEYYLKRHIPFHSKLYHSANLILGGNKNLSNEELLLNAYDGVSSNELIEKLWRYGRYLFISGCSEDGLPFTMYGLWAYEYRQIWSHNMANENIQMIYWHTNVGNLTKLSKSLTEYYMNRIDCFRENAQKLYGCRGIFIPAGTTPNMPYPNQIDPVILNWTCAAGWLAQHYYRYYLYTNDKEYLHSTILPFMKAAADFYEDFIVFVENGKVKIYPSVSPENTPQNFMPKENKSHPMTTTINSTIDLAIIKELFTNLIKLSEENDCYNDKLDIWRNIVNSIPTYKTNKDGAVKEWQDDRFEDRYYHRHLSHLYPVFPGDEITSESNNISSFEKAVDLREIGVQTGWSLVHMAAIYARFERGNDAMQCLNDIAKTCIQKNFFTLHNDWRRMDISLEMESSATVQLDALMGYVNAVQEMILYSSEKLIKLLPALPDNMSKGKIDMWRFVGGSVNMEWDIKLGKFIAMLKADRDIVIDIKLPKIFADKCRFLGNATVNQNGEIVSAKFKKGDVLNIISD